ncbi:MAG TPA: glycosyltransferase, partial [Pseudosphingobacterium sp.]|nr:glycosyltransferase [Pseudosphingobacterium sp.]
RLNAIKRIDLLIEVQKMLCDQHGHVTFNLLVIGDGDQKDNLICLTEIYGLRKNVKFTGAIYDESLNANYLMYSDLCVTPGEVGLTAIHALSYGTPVISHNNLNIQMPEVEAVIEGKTGALYEYESTDALSKCIEDWLKKYPVKTIPIVENCWKVIDLFYNPEYQAKIFEETLVK